MATLASYVQDFCVAWWYNAPMLRLSSFSRHPMVTTTSVLGVKFDGGVMLAADLAGYYGSLAKLRNCPRLLKVNDQIIVGAGGDYADYQFLKGVMDQKV